MLTLHSGCPPPLVPWAGTSRPWSPRLWYSEWQNGGASAREAFQAQTDGRLSEEKHSRSVGLSAGPAALPHGTLFLPEWATDGQGVVIHSELVRHFLRMSKVSLVTTENMCCWWKSCHEKIEFWKTPICHQEPVLKKLRGGLNVDFFGAE